MIFQFKNSKVKNSTLQFLSSLLSRYGMHNVCVFFKSFYMKTFNDKTETVKVVLAI